MIINFKNYFLNENVDNYFTFHIPNISKMIVGKKFRDLDLYFLRDLNTDLLGLFNYEIVEFKYDWCSGNKKKGKTKDHLFNVLLQTTSKDTWQEIKSEKRIDSVNIIFHGNFGSYEVIQDQDVKIYVKKQNPNDPYNEENWEDEEFPVLNKELKWLHDLSSKQKTENRTKEEIAKNLNKILSTRI